MKGGPRKTQTTMTSPSPLPITTTQQTRPSYPTTRFRPLTLLIIDGPFSRPILYQTSVSADFFFLHFPSSVICIQKPQQKLSLQTQFLDPDPPDVLDSLREQREHNKNRVHVPLAHLFPFPIPPDPFSRISLQFAILIVGIFTLCVHISNTYHAKQLGTPHCL